jgi:ATP-dependent Clp protease ATP-binding subunit ClpC
MLECGFAHSAVFPKEWQPYSSVESGYRQARASEVVMYERFTRRAKKVIRSATRAAKKLHHEHMDIEDLLLAILHEQDGGAIAVINALGADWSAIRGATEELIRPVAKVTPSKMQPPALRAKRAIEYAMTQRADMLDDVGTEHLLHGIACEGESKATQVLARFGLTRQVVQTQIRLLATRPD